jgi:hypothetical protein
MGFNKQSDCDEFNQGLKKYKKSGQYQQVYKDFLIRLENVK